MIDHNLQIKSPDMQNRFLYLTDLLASLKNDNIIQNPEICYEIQHTISHLNNASICKGEQRTKEYLYVLGHLQRAILDAYKLLLFDESYFNNILSKPIEEKLNFFSSLFKARCAEVEDFDVSVNYYKALVKSQSNSGNITIQSSSYYPNGQQSFQKLIQRMNDYLCYYDEWSKCEFLLSVFSGMKDLESLNLLVNSFLSGFDVEKLVLAINRLYSKIEYIFFSEFYRKEYVFFNHKYPDCIDLFESVINKYYLRDINSEIHKKCIDKIIYILNDSKRVIFNI